MFHNHISTPQVKRPPMLFVKVNQSSGSLLYLDNVGTIATSSLLRAGNSNPTMLVGIDNDIFIAQNPRANKVVVYAPNTNIITGPVQWANTGSMTGSAGFDYASSTLFEYATSGSAASIATYPFSMTYYTGSMTYSTLTMLNTNGPRNLIHQNQIINGKIIMGHESGSYTGGRLLVFDTKTSSSFYLTASLFPYAGDGINAYSSTTKINRVSSPAYNPRNGELMYLVSGYYNSNTTVCWPIIRNDVESLSTSSTAPDMFAFGGFGPPAGVFLATSTGTLANAITSVYMDYLDEIWFFMGSNQYYRFQLNRAAISGFFQAPTVKTTYLSGSLSGYNQNIGITSGYLAIPMGGAEKVL